MNLEVDIIARYLERLIQGDEDLHQNKQSKAVDLKTLKTAGFISEGNRD